MSEKRTKDLPEDLAYKAHTNAVDEWWHDGAIYAVTTEPLAFGSESQAEILEPETFPAMQQALTEKEALALLSRFADLAEANESLQQLADNLADANADLVREKAVLAEERDRQADTIAKLRESLDAALEDIEARAVATNRHAGTIARVRELAQRWRGMGHITKQCSRELIEVLTE